MGTIGKRVYEALFLMDTAMAAADWDGTLKVIETVLSRGEAEILSIRKWDERKLAYDIDGKGRGTYILVYFRMDTQKVTVVERAIWLSEKIMRVMILRTDRMTQTDGGTGGVASGLHSRSTSFQVSARSSSVRAPVRSASTT